MPDTENDKYYCLPGLPDNQKAVYYLLRIIIVDDQLLLLDLLVQMLQNAEDIEIVARAVDGNEAIDAAKRYSPDVILMDVKMPVCDGIEATAKIKDLNEGIKVLLLTSSEERDDVIRALKSGADGYILKSVSKEELLLAIKAVSMNMRIIQHDLRDMLLSSEIGSGGSFTDNMVIVNDMEVQLTDREVEIIRMIVDGKSIEEMSVGLFLTEGRIRNVITEILSKLMLKDRTQLAVFALRNKIA